VPLTQTGAIGGDQQRARQAFNLGPHPDRNGGAKARPVKGSGWRRARAATASMTCIQKMFA
jgi:hypothetical protein